MFLFTCVLSIFNFPCRGSPFNVMSAPLTRPSINQPSWNIKPDDVNLRGGGRQTGRHKVFQCVVLRLWPWWYSIPMKEHYLNWHPNWALLSDRNCTWIGFLCLYLSLTLSSRWLTSVRCISNSTNDNYRFWNKYKIEEIGLICHQLCGDNSSWAR